MGSDENPQTSSLKAKTTRGLFWSGLSNILQQIFGVVFGILLARMLTLEDYGMIGMIMIFSVVASALQESGFISGLANKDDVEHKDYNAVFWCSVLVATLLYLLLFFISPWIARFYGIPELTLLARISFLGFWVGSFGIAHQAYLFRNLMVRERSLTLLLAIIVSGVVGVLLASQGFGYWGIAIQGILYPLVTSIFATWFSGFRPSFRIDLRPVRSILNYSSKVLITNIFIHTSNHVFALILGRFYSVGVVGSLTQANKWNLMGQSVISGMANSITQPVMRELQRDRNRQSRVFRKIVQFTAFVSFPCMFGLALVAEDFIVIAITDKWLESASLLRVFAIGGAFSVVSVVFSNFILSQGKSNVYMWVIIVFGVLQIGLLMLLHPYGALYMVSATAILQLIWFFVWYIQVYRYLTYTFLELAKDVFSYALLALVSIFVTYWLAYPVDHLYGRFFLSVVITCGIYIGTNFWLKPAIIKEAVAFLIRKIRM